MNWRAVVTLLRPPNVFTAVADSIAGLAVVRAMGVELRPAHCLVVAASALLYLAGMALNDVFDREIDAVERPERPIPSGAISLRHGVLLGTGLMVAGLVAAALAGTYSAVIGLLLAGAILGYDGGLKQTAAGPWAMGSCRALNFALGLAPALPVWAAWKPLALAGPIFLGLYVTALTYIARDEVQGNTEARARTGLIAMLALLFAAAVCLVASRMLPMSGWAWVFFLALALRWYQVWSPLWTRHDGPTTGRAIGGGILLIPLIDATICAVVGDLLAAAAVASLMGPALLLKKWFSPT